MTQHNRGADEPSAGGLKKVYTSPTLTEYGNVAKLTMVKGTTLTEISPNKKQACL